MDTPPFRITEVMLEEQNKQELVERLNSLFEELFRTKEDKPEFRAPSP